MKVDHLYLEVTRNCTLECEHCLRGDRERVNMSPTILDEIFKDVEKVGVMLITGGEPLLAIQTLEYLVELLKKKKVSVGKILLITNGTVLSDRVMNVLYGLQEHSYLVLKISTDIFHRIELEKRGLLELRDRNLSYLNKAGFYNFSEYGEDKKSEYNVGLVNKGRTRSLTLERLEEINSLVEQKYSVMDYTTCEQLLDVSLEDDIVYGTLSVDVNGNLVGYELSFEEEDEFAYNAGINVTQMSFRDAVQAFINLNDKKREERYKKLGIKLN